MGGTAPANQLRLSFAGPEDGEAETETCRAAKPLWRTTTRTSRPVRAQLTEPPYADPHLRWCGRGGRVTVPPMPIATAIPVHPEVRRRSALFSSPMHFFPWFSRSFRIEFLRDILLQQFPRRLCVLFANHQLDPADEVGV